MAQANASSASLLTPGLKGVPADGQQGSAAIARRDAKGTPKFPYVFVSMLPKVLVSKCRIDEDGGSTRAL